MCLCPTKDLERPPASRAPAPHKAAAAGGAQLRASRLPTAHRTRGENPPPGHPLRKYGLLCTATALITSGFM